MREIAVRQGLASRERKWRLYEEAFPPRREERILDLGVSELDDLPGENYFLRRYPYLSQVTAVGVDDLDALRERYPDVTFIQADGRDLPFKDGSFDIVHSNAVIEHVGASSDQRRFVAELIRVAKAGFVTTPNRWFPIETHTRLPLLHWLPRRMLVPTMRHVGHDDWPIWLLSRRSFSRMFPQTVDLTVTTQRLLGMAMTITIIFRTPG